MTDADKIAALEEKNAKLLDSVVKLADQVSRLAERTPAPAYYPYWGIPLQPYQPPTYWGGVSGYVSISGGSADGVPNTYAFNPGTASLETMAKKAHDGR